MTYSYVHRAINEEAFPMAPDLYDKELMTGRGRGRYCYRPEVRAEAEAFCGKKSKGFWEARRFCTSVEKDYR